MIYYNLTQCANVKPLDNNPHFIYIRSTDIEQHNWKRLLWSVPDEMLFFLYREEPITIFDVSKGSGKVEKIFVPVLEDLLNGFSGKADQKHRNLTYHYKLAKELVICEQMLFTKYTFWTSRFRHPVDIVGITAHVDKEPNPLMVH